MLSLLNPEIQPILDEMNAAAGPPAHELPINEARATHVAETAWLCGEGEPVAEIRNVTVPGPGGEIPVRIYVPEQPDGVLAYIHGGGWIMGTLDGYDAALTRVANAAGTIVASIDYRLAPEHRFPTAVNDAFDALRWLAAHGREALRIDASRLAVGGDSAGGTLAAVAAIQARDAGLPLALQLLVTPGTTAHADTASHRLFANGFLLDAVGIEWFFDQYIDRAERTDWRFAPLLADDLDGVAPACVILAECDPLVDEGLAYADRLRLAGVPVQLELVRGVTHDFIKMARALPEAVAAQDAAARAMKEALRP